MKYIDVDKFIEVLEEMKKAEYENCGGVNAKTRILQEVQELIPSLQQEQPEVDLENLPKIRGWVAVNRYGCSPRAYFYPTKPKRQDGYWTEGRNVTNLAVPNWNGKFEDEPVEVELLIKKI